MIPEYYYDDPFVLNLSSDDLSDLFVEFCGDTGRRRLKKAVLNNDHADLQEIFEITIKGLMAIDLNNGHFGIVHDGHAFIKEAEVNPFIEETLKEIGIDVTHLKGIAEEDAVRIVIPFENKDDMEYLGYVCRKNFLIEYWENGKFLTTNYEMAIKK